MPDEDTRRIGVLKVAHSLRNVEDADTIPDSRKAHKKSRKCQKCGRITVVELTDTTTMTTKKRPSLVKGKSSRKTLLAQKSYGEMTHREKRKFKKKSHSLNRRIGYVDKFIATCVTCLYLLYPTLTRSTFKLVACQTVGCNRYLQMDLDLQCWIVHIPWVILLFLQRFYCMCRLPLAALYFLHKNTSTSKIKFHGSTLAFCTSAFGTITITRKF